VRAASDAAAAERLRAGYDSGDAGLLAAFDSLAGGGRLVTYPGNPCSDANRLAWSCCTACTHHAAASHVNIILAALFGCVKRAWLSRV
jgi:hypothetical protein